MRICSFFLLATTMFGHAALVPAQLAPAMRASIDAAATRVLGDTGVPSATLGIVMNGKIVLTTAYGEARLSPPLRATAEMAYPIGSISKQFTASAMLLLQEDGKLSLDDKVSRFFPELTRADEVTLRELLSHTSGYEDYAPQDYTIPAWTRPTTPLDLVHVWAEKPLDFDPGTQWQYSNTNFVIAALIVEKASGVPFAEFLKKRVLERAGIVGALNLNVDQARLEPTGYMRNALGPLRPARMEAPGWYFGDGDLALPVDSLLAWDITLMNHGVLAPASYDEFFAEVKLKDGRPSGYGLGVDVGIRNGHRTIAHSGEVGGFVAQNTFLPDDRIAVAVLTNQEASSAASQIADAVVALLTRATAPAAEDHSAAEKQARTILEGLIAGTIDRGLFTEDGNFYFSKEAIEDFSSSLAPLGGVTGVSQRGQQLRGGMTYRTFAVSFLQGEKKTSLTLTTYTRADGKLEQFLIEP